ncbi:FecR family protein [Prolixibacteraceae bacterium JC049]|nr:FecR family protein [Prolixibacteraceae bacterium JC049]
MEKHHEISRLIAHYINGSITAEQQVKLDNWINSSDQNKKIFDQIIASDYGERIDAQPDWEDLQLRIKRSKPIHTSHQINSWKLRLINVAAACAAIVGVYWYVDQKITEVVPQQVQQIAQSEPVIGKGAVLTTEGKTFDLQKESININIKGMKAKAAAGKLKVSCSDIKPDIKPVISQLKVPRGGVFQMELPDGTKVWVNSESELEFPSKFTGNRRLVKVKGEAYFEVESDKANPFFVQTPKALVRVTGTRFNVSAYQNDIHTAVTLAEGHVDVELEKKWHQLSPGKQISYHNTNGEIHTRKVDVSSLTSWINGIFEFEDMAIENLVVKLERWYDMEFVFKNEQVKKQRFTGAVKKDVSISYLLDMITETTNMNYSIANKQVIIE